MSNKYSAIERHAKLLMLAGVTKLPMHLINRLKWDLGPHDIVGNLVDDFSDYSGAFEVEDVVTGKVEIGLGSWLLEKGACFLSIGKKGNNGL
ncbi:protein ROOT PRIMORDIUM DEFECTIVE 1 [Prunus yedoensis var. nudiflora]|uniref:Protein ROOT PRIMORDIUM DEFECTIVE 1 n=1 Tax=Prunus yedoensis var. nudiflora TaxID=2094558 RepID=A0A314YAG5_PRUYE|nr:protein ROOT PRIMORDIUM DEFECTIVE 1 [Prunus yedoensis var. nudiflora]